MATIDLNLSGTLTIKKEDMTAIRNSAVAKGLLTTTGSQLVYTVPSGFVLLLKNILISAPGLPAMVVSGSLQGAPTTPNPALFYTSEPVFGVFSWTGWVALNEGDKLILSSSVAPSDYWVSGALLPFAPGL